MCKFVGIVVCLVMFGAVEIIKGIGDAVYYLPNSRRTKPPGMPGGFVL